MLNDYLYQESKCKEHHCQINNKNINTVYKPNRGLKKKIPKSNNKFCDCIIECNNNKI